MKASHGGSIAVTLVSAWPDHLQEQSLSLPAGASLGDALAAAGKAMDAAKDMASKAADAVKK